MHRLYILLQLRVPKQNPTDPPTPRIIPHSLLAPIESFCESGTLFLWLSWGEAICALPEEKLRCRVHRQSEE